MLVSFSSYSSSKIPCQHRPIKEDKHTFLFIRSKIWPPFPHTRKLVRAYLLKANTRSAYRRPVLPPCIFPIHVLFFQKEEAHSTAHMTDHASLLWTRLKKLIPILLAKKMNLDVAQYETERKRNTYRTMLELDGWKTHSLAPGILIRASISIPQFELLLLSRSWSQLARPHSDKSKLAYWTRKRK